MAAADVDIAAITLDLDDTLWPIEPVIARAEERLDAWLKIHCPRATAAWASRRRRSSTLPARA
jgi:putative hydrolase of the HAD superfamily